ncbi:MAG: ParB/RepB/Spo0J family partition protein [Erysipelotrichaceae bacterium]
MAKNKLGKGLANIYGDDLYNVIDELENSGPTDTIKVKDIKANPYQPRKVFDEASLNELAESIKQHGIFTPLLVKKGANGYILIAGERRLRASKLANVTEVPVIIVDFDDQQMMEISLLENIQRENLNVIEEANAYQKLIESLNYTQENLATRVNKSRAHITNTLRLLKLPKQTQELVAIGKLAMGHVRPLITLNDQKKINEYAEKIINEGLSVRQVENLVKTKQPTTTNIKKDKDLINVEKIIAEKLQTIVKVDNKQITIKYSGTKDLNRILEILDCLDK